MYFMYRIALPLFSLWFGQFMMVSNGDLSERKYSGIIEVKNGQVWGSWGPRQMCPQGTFATGFSLKVEASVGDGDDTALNGIALRCTKPMGYGGSTKSYTTITSTVGSWGTWTPNLWCTKGALQSFWLRVEPRKGSGDDTAANNIKFYCTGKELLTGSGMHWGDWRVRSPRCVGTGICGIQTKVEPPQGSGDDTALNDVRFYCC